MEKRQCTRRQVNGDAAVSLRPLDPQVWCRYWGETEYSIRDISMVGIGISSRENITPGARLSIDLRLGKATSSIRVFGKVAWVIKEADQYRAGVSFSWWRDDQDKKVVTRFVERLHTDN